jgi:AcrR family transcriptional regulator
MGGFAEDVSLANVDYSRGVANVADTPNTTLRERKAQRTRAELIDAAVKLCLSVGYENATIELISAAADVSPRTFSRYFSTKDAVFLALLDAVSDDVVAEVSEQSEHLGPLEAMRAAHVAVLTRIADRPYRQPSADQVTLMLRVINSSDVLRKKAIEYRNPRVMKILADRAGVPLDDRRLELARTLFSVTVVTACANLVADTEPALLGPRVMAQRLEEAFAQLAEMAADLKRS